MKRILYLIPAIMLVNISFYSCTSYNNSDRYSEVYKVISECLYDYYSYNDDSLVVGISSIFKDTYIYQDGSTSYRLRFTIEGYKDGTDSKCLTLNPNEVKRVDVFLDSCNNGNLASDYESWEIKVQDSVYLEYNSYNKTVHVSYHPNYYSDLRIRPTLLKNIINKALQNNNQ